MGVATAGTIMEWQDARRSDAIEDRRGGGGDTGGGGGFGVGTGSLGIGTIIVLALIGYATGIDPRILIGGAEVVTGGRTQPGYTSGPYGQSGAPPQRQAQSGQGAQGTIPSDRMGDFVAAILGEIEDIWTTQLPAQTRVDYVRPSLVLYSGVTRSGCGTAQSAMGPFYCPTDRKIYLDMAFFDQMRRRLGGGGDFAYAYVIAHEVGHHVQNLLGILPKVHAAQENADQAQANALSVRLELQADCFAGVWAANANASKGGHYLDTGDAGKAEATAAAIGDDTLQKASRGYAVPDSFTHGSSAQRQKWLETGLSTGKVASCNTFAQQ